MPGTDRVAPYASSSSQVRLASDWLIMMILASYWLTKIILTSDWLTDNTDLWLVTDWPEQGVPKSGEGFIDFIGQVRWYNEYFMDFWSSLFFSGSQNQGAVWSGRSNLSPLQVRTHCTTTWKYRKTVFFHSKYLSVLKFMWSLQPRLSNSCPIPMSECCL